MSSLPRIRQPVRSRVPLDTKPPASVCSAPDAGTRERIGGKDASRQIPFRGFVEGWCWHRCVQRRGLGTDRGRGMSQPWQLQSCGLGYPWRWLRPWKPDIVAVQEFISPDPTVGAPWLGLISLDSVSFRRVHGHTLHG